MLAGRGLSRGKVHHVLKTGIGKVMCADKGIAINMLTVALGSYNAGYVRGVTLCDKKVQEYIQKNLSVLFFLLVNFKRADIYRDPAGLTVCTQIRHLSPRRAEIKGERYRNQPR